MRFCHRSQCSKGGGKVLGEPDMSKTSSQKLPRVSLKIDSTPRPRHVSGAGARGPHRYLFPFNRDLFGTIAIFEEEVSVPAPNRGPFFVAGKDRAPGWGDPFPPHPSTRQGPGGGANPGRTVHPLQSCQAGRTRTGCGGGSGSPSGTVARAEAGGEGGCEGGRGDPGRWKRPTKR